MRSRFRLALHRVGPSGATIKQNINFVMEFTNPQRYATHVVRLLLWAFNFQSNDLQVLRSRNKCPIKGQQLFATAPARDPAAARRRPSRLLLDRIIIEYCRAALWTCDPASAGVANCRPHITLGRCHCGRQDKSGHTANTDII